MIHTPHKRYFQQAPRAERWPTEAPAFGLSGDVHKTDMAELVMLGIPSLEELWKAYPDRMDKKEIESPKLTARFLIWITGFLIVLFALIAHFVWRVF